jgi:ArsR family transcriptional regulator, zinc-responsive transcriptional repressor
MKKAEHHHLPEQTVENAAAIFKTLSDPTRIRLLYLLSEEECSVNHISDVLGMSQSAISHQLRVLRNMRLVKFRREGHYLYYSCDDEHVIRLLQLAIEHSEHE